MILNSYQQAAVENDSPVCLVNANVGSGKTTVLIEKIVYLQNVKQIDLKDMVVLTFTNKAANEIKERLGQETKALYFGTFHSVAMRLLQERLPVEKLAYTKEFQIMLPEEELEIARGILSEKQLNIKYKNRLKKRIEQWENGRGDNYGDDMEKLLHALHQEKKNQDKMTYRDLITNSSHLLKEHPDCFRAKWLIIDEVQDCDHDQLELIDALKQPDTSLFAVGDPNQVIYGWRGSAFQVFHLLKTRYQAEVLSLPLNYRSTGTILQAASRFKQNSQSLSGIQDQGEKIRITGHYDPLTEADYLAGMIQMLHSRGIAYREIGIFYRLQNQAQILRDTFERNGIPIEISMRQQFFEIPVINWLYHLFRFLANESDKVSLTRIISDKQYGDGITGKKLEKLLRLEQTDGIPIIKQVEGIFHSDWYHRTVDEDWIEAFQQEIHLKERIGLTSAQAAEDIQNAQLFFEQFQNSKKNIKEFVNEAALYGISFAKEEQTGNEEAVQAMTLHASKGLEFSHVFIIGVNQGMIPLRGQNEAEEEEEQRLLFVGMTRAKEYLELSYYNSSPAPLVLPGPSPYLFRIRQELVEVPLAGKKDQKQAAEHLQRLKREILHNRMEKGKESDPIPGSTVLETKREESREEVQEKKIRIEHARYGKGWIISQDEEKILFAFDDFGEKEMLKILCNFTILEE